MNPGHKNCSLYYFVNKGDIFSDFDKKILVQKMINSDIEIFYASDMISNNY